MIVPMISLPPRPVALQREKVSGRRQCWALRQVDQTTTEIRLYDEVGLWGQSADAFAAMLDGISTPNITLRLNSPGGDVWDGVAIANQLHDHPASVTVLVDGLAASIASVIAMAGDRVVMGRKARMMIHDASGACVGPEAAMRASADLLGAVSEDIASVYAERAGGDPADWRSRMLAETWYTADQAVEAGLADETASDPPPPVEPEAAVRQLLAGAAPDGAFLEALRRALAVQVPEPVIPVAGRVLPPAPAPAPEPVAALPPLGLADLLRAGVRRAVEDRPEPPGDAPPAAELPGRPLPPPVDPRRVRRMIQEGTA